MVSFYKHELVKLDNGYLLKLYLDPQLTEFANEFNKGNKEEQEGLESSARKYVKERFPNLKVNAVKIMAGTMLVSTLAFAGAGAIGSKAQAAEIDGESSGVTVVEDINDDTTPAAGGNDEAPAAGGDDEAPATEGAAKNFTDLVKGAYYEEAVKSLTAAGVINGYDDGTFKPLNDITRGEAAKIIAESLNLDEVEAPDPGFTDINDKQYHYKSIAALAERGVIDGYGDDTFRPNQPITRGELAKMIVEAYDDIEEDPTFTATSTFTDVPSNKWYAPYVAALTKNGITLGTSDKTFSPELKTKRGETATFIYRVLNPDKRVEVVNPTDPGDNEPTIDEAQFVYDVNRIEGEGNLSEKFSELGYESFDELSEAAKTEVAALFILSKGDTTYTSIDEIKADIDKTIGTYDGLLTAVNNATGPADMKTALQSIATLYGIDVTDEMAQKAVDQKADGYSSVADIIDVLQTENVANLAEFKNALASDDITKINITADFTTAEELVVSKPITIDGGGNSITFTGDATGWQGNYVLQVYNTTGVTISDLALTGADGALLVNGSNVTLTGAIDVSANEFGGIEVSKGSDVTNQPSLNVADADFTNTTEAFGLPTIWEDKLTGTVTGGDFTTNDTAKPEQVQYYLDAAHSTAPQE